MKVKAKTAFYYEDELYKRNDVLEIKDKDFDGINMVKIEEDAEVEEEPKPTKVYTKKATTKKTSSKKSK